MNSSYLAYKLLTTAAAPFVLPLIWMHHRFRGDNFQRFFQRIGIYPPGLIRRIAHRPRIWIHAVSVGEAGVAAAIGEALLTYNPQAAMALSTVREQGLSRAQALLGKQVPCFFAPLDLVGATRKALRCFDPDVLVLLETEIWPNLIVQAKRMGIRTAIVNGRISTRTIRNYRKVRSLMAYTLSHIDAFSLISKDDAHRFVSLGAPIERIQVNGNAKFDRPDPLGNDGIKADAMALLNLDGSAPVVVAGSTRHAEEPELLKAFNRVRKVFPESILIIAPRHIERVDQIGQWVDEFGLSYQLRSNIDTVVSPRTSPVVILDTMGELSAIYSVADVVFCGGSLVPKGGQNILEPAMWGKPVIYGPSMEDFAEARQVIQQSGGGKEVRNAEDIVTVVSEWLQSPREASAAGLAARNAIMPHRGAAAKHAAAIHQLLLKKREDSRSCVVKGSQ